MNNRINTLEKKYKKSKVILNNIQASMILSHSIDKIRSNHSEVRQNALEALASMKDNRNLEQNDKVFTIVLSEALYDLDREVVLKVNFLVVFKSKGSGCH